MADFYTTQPSTGIAGLGQQPTLQQLLASLSSARPAAAQPAAASAATPASAPTVAGSLATGQQQQGSPSTGPLSDSGLGGAAQTFAGRNVAAQPSLMSSLKLAGMIPGFGPMTALTSGIGALTGVTGNPLAVAGPSLSPAQQQQVAQAYMSGGPVAATTVLNGIRAQMMTQAAGMQTGFPGGANVPAGSLGSGPSQSVSNAGQTQTGGLSITGTGASMAGVPSGGSLGGVMAGNYGGSATGQQAGGNAGGGGGGGGGGVSGSVGGQGGSFGRE